MPKGDHSGLIGHADTCSRGKNRTGGKKNKAPNSEFYRVVSGIGGKKLYLMEKIFWKSRRGRSPGGEGGANKKKVTKTAARKRQKPPLSSS